MRQALILVGVAATACYDGGEAIFGLAPVNGNDAGPSIRWDLDARPLPEIPFPNDVGTRPDGTSPTARRINVSQVAPTRHESQLRRLINELDGFATYGPIWIPFDGRIEVSQLYNRQLSPDPNDDAVFLVRLDTGERAALDVGHPIDRRRAARFNLLLEQSDLYFQNDPRAQASNLVFETVDEDLDGDGRMVPAEDTDGDGRLDVPNLWGTVLGDDRLLDPYRDLMSLYELETDTLILRPAVPLAEATTYAVIVTRRLVGLDNGSPVRSPFASINHHHQSDPLRALIDDGILTDLGLELTDVAFTWTFTTQTVTAELSALREGMYGRGPFGRLATDFSPRVARVPRAQDPAAANPYIFPVPRLVDALNDSRILTVLDIPGEQADELAQSYLDHVDYFAFFELDSPALIENADGVFRADTRTGHLEYGRERLYLVCSVPKVGKGPQPFPVVFYNHGSGSTRLEMLGFGGAMARFGLATCAFDAYGHGLIDNEVIRGLADSILNQQSLFELGEIIFSGRSRDLNGDGFSDSGGDFWTANILHTRDVVRQSVVDYFRVISVMRAFGSTTMPVDVDGDGAEELAGDFNGDGIVDFGGDQPYYAMGQSLGGIIISLVAASEPMVAAAAPVAAGGGLSDIAIRSDQPGMVEAVFMPLMGPLIVGRELAGGRTELFLDTLDVITEREVRFATVPDSGAADDLQVGDRLEVLNLDNGEASSIVILDPRNFRVPIAADRGDRLRVSIYRFDSGAAYRVIDTFERLSIEIEEGGYQGRQIDRGDVLVALQDGFGFRRGTPSFRRILGVAQTGLDRGDPINYARRWHHPPPGTPAKNVLLYGSTGDTRVPISTGIALARAAGWLDAVDPRYDQPPEALLAETFVMEGLEKLQRFAHDGCRYDAREVLLDIDDAAGGIDPAAGPRLSQLVSHPECVGPVPERPVFCFSRCRAFEPLRLKVPTETGTSGMRFMYLDPTGGHSFRLPNADPLFDHPLYTINQIAWYFSTGGQEIVDDPCLQDRADPCSFFD